jgi:hypothetical protein
MDPITDLADGIDFVISRQCVSLSFFEAIKVFGFRILRNSWKRHFSEEITFRCP